jgi:hypothetical protein
MYSFFLENKNINRFSAIYFTYALIVRDKLIVFFNGILAAMTASLYEKLSFSE